MTEVAAPNATFEPLARRLGSILGSDIGIACSAIHAGTECLYPDEFSAVRNAVTKRQREFATGRANARLAMTRIGERCVSIPMLADRAPAWPVHLVGSISHTHAACAAVVGRKKNVRSIGIDLERDRPMEEALWPSIWTTAEEAHVRAQPIEWQGHLMIRLFSAKEAVYKWQYPLTRRMLDFNQVEVTWLDDGPEARFVAQVNGAGILGPVQGQCLVHENLVVSLVCMR